MRNILGINFKYYVGFVLMIGLVLVFIEPLSFILLEIGSKLNYDTTAFKSGYTIISFSIVVLYFYFIVKGYIHNKRTTFLVFLTCAIYVLYRFVFTDYISFYSIDLINSFLFYSDLTLVITGFHFLCLVRVFTKNRKRLDERFETERLDTLTSEKHSFFIEDKPYAEKEIDNEAILLKLIEVVTGFKPSEAFSIGLNAVWGYGKSSFLHRFKNKFERDNPREIVFWYRIWKNKGSNAIIENFFEELKHQLKPYSGEIADDINNYVESILSLSHSEIQKIASVGKAIISDKETLENHFQGINHSIAKIDRQIIILLDDLDRLEDSEIMNTLKLIRTLSDFNNIIFIAGYDRQYITETIDASKSNYLDKIFNVEINLLPFDSELIVSELEIEVNKIFVDQLGINDNNNFNEAFKNLFKDLTLKGEDISLDDMFKENAGQNCQSNYVLKYQDFLLTYRDVKRFINEFKFNFSFLSNQADVIPQEYILLKLLTYKFRELNNLLFANLDYYLKRDNKDLGNDGIISFGSDYRSNIYIYNSESQKKLRDKLKNIDDDHFNIINAVMCRLFGEKSINFYQSNQNCISKIYYTDLYLRNNILSGNISLSDFQKAFKENQLFQLVQSISFNADKININTANEIKQFIYNVSIDSKKRFLDVIKTINFVFNSSNIYDQLKVLSLLNESYVEYYGYYDQTFIEDLQEVINIPSIGFLDSLFRDMNLDIKRKNSKLDYKSNNINKYDTSNLREKDIEQLMLGKLKFLLEKNVDPELIIQFYYTDVAAIVGDKKIIRSIDFNLLIQNDIHHRFPKYFHSTLFESITKRISDSNGEFFGYEPMFHLAQIFSNQKTVKELIKFPSDIKIFNQYYIEGWHNLLEYLEGIKKQKNYKKEIDDSKLDFSIEFLKQFIKNDYKPLSKNQYDEIWNNLPF